VLRRLRLAACLLCGLAATLACREPSPPPAPPAELETVEVAPAADAGLTTAHDAQDTRPPEALAGILPGDFPGDVPLPQPASLIDFGEVEDGRRYVLVQTPEAPSAVRAALARRLERAGWTADPDGAVHRKGGRLLRLTFEDARPGTRVRVEYSPG
jgi:hypothetical protein